MILKKFFIWSTILVISISLIITGFTLNPKNNENKKEYINISNKKIDKSDIKKLIDFIKNKNTYLNNIDDIDIYLKNLIIENVKKNIYSEKNKSNITKYELLKTILNINEFKIKGYFSDISYKNFLKKKQLTEFDFQHRLNKNLNKTHINAGLKIIKRTYKKNIKNIYTNFKKKNTKYLVVKKNNKLKIKSLENQIYINSSLKKIIKNLKINTNDLNLYIKKNDDIIILKCYILNKQKINKKNIIINKKELQTNYKNSFIYSNKLFIQSNKLELNFNQIKNEIIASSFKIIIMKNLINIKTYIKNHDNFNIQNKTSCNKIKKTYLFNKKTHTFKNLKNKNNINVNNNNNTLLIYKNTSNKF